MFAKLRAGSVAIAFSFSAATAGAFCRTTTCDVDNPDPSCTHETDGDGCTVTGMPLYWPEGCSWFGVQEDGSKTQHIDYDVAQPLIVKAFKKWGSVTCAGGGNPSFFMADTDALYGKAVCNEHEFSQKTANANVWMFRDTDWPYTGATSTIALTTLTVNLNNGEIFDADVEINSFGVRISTSDQNVEADLESIVTHEAGHFLGLAHSQVAAATMFANYSPRSITIRTLDADDEDAVCSLFPPKGTPSCPAPEPRYGFSRFCGGINPSTQPHPTSNSNKSSSCAVSSSNERSSEWPFVVAAAAILVSRTRRRFAKRPTC